VKAMALYKRGDVYWSYVWIDGVRNAKSTGTGSRRQAELMDRRHKDELMLKKQGVSQAKPDMTFGELAACFLAENPPKPHHIDRLKMLLPYWSETPIGRITKAQAREYRKRRQAEKPISDTTVNRDLEVLRHLLFWAVEEGLLAANPIGGMRMVRARRKPRIVVSLEEEEKLLAAAAPHLRSIIIIALDSGMRRGEILRQLAEHIDLTRRLLYVTKSKTAGGEAREIPLTDRLFNLLREDHRPGLLCTFKGRSIHRIKTAWKGTIRRAGIRYFRFHDLRHTFNTRLMEAGVMQEIRKSLMGHSSGEEVNSIYTHVETPAKREAIRKLEAWVRTQRNTQGEQHGFEHRGNGEASPNHDERLPADGGDHAREA